MENIVNETAEKYEMNEANLKSIDNKPEEITEISEEKSETITEIIHGDHNDKPEEVTEITESIEETTTEVEGDISNKPEEVNKEITESTEDSVSFSDKVVMTPFNYTIIHEKNNEFMELVSYICNDDAQFLSVDDEIEHISPVLIYAADAIDKVKLDTYISKGFQRILLFDKTGKENEDNNVFTPDEFMMFFPIKTTHSAKICAMMLLTLFVPNYKSPAKKFDKTICELFIIGLNYIGKSKKETLTKISNSPSGENEIGSIVSYGDIIKSRSLTQMSKGAYFINPGLDNIKCYAVLYTDGIEFMINNVDKEKSAESIDMIIFHTIETREIDVGDKTDGKITELDNKNNAGNKKIFIGWRILLYPLKPEVKVNDILKKLDLKCHDKDIDIYSMWCPSELAKKIIPYL